MKHQSPAEGFGVLCQPSGIIDRFVRDDLNLNHSFRGRHFKELLDTGSWAKSQVFLDTVGRSGAANDWELDVKVHDVRRTMHFAGGAMGGAYFICGVCSKDAMTAYLREMTQSEIDCDKSIFAALEQLIESRSPQFSEADTLECLSSLNSELLNVQRELQKKNIQLKSLNDEKNRALGIVAHDLRNPIAILTMYATYLIQSLEERVSAEELDCLTTIKRTAASMSELVNDVLDVAAIESGQLKLRLDDVDVARLLNDIVQRLRPLARERNVELRFASGRDRTFSVLGDAGKLEQVFNNLIDNAVKFSPPKGVVESSVTADASQVFVTVSDSGPGISEEARKTLFQPFATGRDTSNHGNTGTGLGLSIARRIVEGHGGSIEVESATTHGTIFRVTLPRSA